LDATFLRARIREVIRARESACAPGHASLQSTEIYLRADPTEKLETLNAITPLSLQRGRFRVPDKLIAMLKAVGGSKNYAE
jgi:hypothetical protein